MGVVADLDAATFSGQQRRVFKDKDTITKPYRSTTRLIHEQRVIAEVTVFADFEAVRMDPRQGRSIAFLEVSGKANISGVGLVADTCKSSTQNANYRQPGESKRPAFPPVALSPYVQWISKKSCPKSVDVQSVACA